jgi:hypothetical protein
VAVLPAKLRIKNLELPTDVSGRFEERRAEYETDWERNLIPLLAPASRIPFEDAWGTVKRAVALVGKSWRP